MNVSLKIDVNPWILNVSGLRSNPRMLKYQSYKKLNPNQ